MIEIQYEHSLNLPQMLQQLGVSLLVSTYQAGKLVAIHGFDQKLAISFHTFKQPMGVAVDSKRVAVGAGNQIWFLENAPDIARKVEPVGRYDACYVARSSRVTGEIHGHELAWTGDDLWVVNTLFSCLCTLDDHHSFVPRWRPPFVSALAPEDRCHLNGLALANGQPKYVTALGRTDSPGGWRTDKVTKGVILEVDSGEIILDGLCMPHSPRWHLSKLWVLDSGNGRLCTVDHKAGRHETVAELPGYTRGLDFVGPYAFVGLSRIRETSTFGGVPIAEHRRDLKCGVWVVDCRSGQSVMSLEFKSGVEEIFAVQIAPAAAIHLSGPMVAEDGEKTIWTVPQPAAHQAHNSL